MKFGFLVTTLALLIAGPAIAGPATDTDGDGTFDVLDICSTVATVPSPCGDDTDGDGYGNGCDGDFNNDGVVNAVDSGIYLPSLSTGVPDAVTGTDLNCDGVVNAVDSGIYLGQLGAGVPGPSGLSCAGTVPCP